MARLYTTEEAYKKLGVSQATFYRWVMKARADGDNDKVEAQPSQDGRESLYLLSQLRWLATQHGKDLLPDDEALVQETTPLEILRRELEEVRQQLAEERAERLRLQEHVQQLEQQVKEAYSFCIQQIGQVYTDLARLHVQPDHPPLPWSPTSSPSVPISPEDNGGRSPTDTVP